MKTIIILLVLSVIGVSVGLYFYLQKDKKESFWGTSGFSRGYEVQKVIHPQNESSPYSLPKREFHSKYGSHIKEYVDDKNLRPVMPPRFSNVDYGAHLRSSMPDEDKTGVPAQCHSKPVGEVELVNKQGNLEKAIVYDRHIYANQRSRLRGLGDAIRGDLPIPRNKKSCGWFSVSANPEIDLRRGALDIIGGEYNETSHALHELQGDADHSYQNPLQQSEIILTNNGADLIIDSGLDMSSVCSQ